MYKPPKGAITIGNGDRYVPRSEIGPNLWYVTRYGELGGAEPSWAELVPAWFDTGCNDWLFDNYWDAHAFSLKKRGKRGK